VPRKGSRGPHGKNKRTLVQSKKKTRKVDDDMMEVGTRPAQVKKNSPVSGGRRPERLLIADDKRSKRVGKNPERIYQGGIIPTYVPKIGQEKKKNTGTQA